MAHPPAGRRREEGEGSAIRLSDTGLDLHRDGEFEDLGLLGTDGLGYLSDARYVDRVRGPVITTLEISGLVPDHYGVALARDPETAFWDLHVRLMADGFYLSTGLVLKGRDSVIHDSAVIGKEGFEIHNSRKIPHAGWVNIGDRVTIGAHTAVDRSVWKEPTLIGDDTHIDNLVHVAHNVRIGKRCRIVAGTVLGGSCALEDDVFLGIGVRVRPGVRVGARSFIGMSVTVLEDVPPDSRLTCR